MIVTIIVIIILAAVVILTITKNNPIENAKEATFKEDVRSFQDDLALMISKEYTDKQGQRDEKITTNNYDKIKEKIPSFTEKYKNKFIIENDKLVGTDKLTDKEKKWAEDLNISTSGKSAFDANEWDASATPEECFEWEGTVIVGINTDMLTDRTKLKIPSKCTEINPKYVSTYESYRLFMPELQEIEIPNTVTTIGDYAFHNAQGIKNIVIPDSVTTIGDYAFSYCKNLESITMSNNIISMGDSVFSMTKWYDSQPNGVIYIDNILYAYKGSMPENTFINIKDGTVVIAGYAFLDCISLKEITIPNSVVNIESRAFWNCRGLEGVIIPNGTKSIGSQTFEGCRKLKNIVLPDTITNIGGNAFAYCVSLTDIVIPSGVTKIESHTFMDCGNLTNVTLPNSIAYIGYEVFDHMVENLNIDFNGTKEQFNSINKDSAWKRQTTTITCTDGTITL